jgi:hypothetical protein
MLWLPPVYSLRQDTKPIFEFDSSKSTGLRFWKLHENFYNYSVTETRVIDSINFVNEGLSSQEDRYSDTKDAKVTSCLAVIMILVADVDG